MGHIHCQVRNLFELLVLVIRCPRLSASVLNELVVTGKNQGKSGHQMHVETLQFGSLVSATTAVIWTRCKYRIRKTWSLLR